MNCTRAIILYILHITIHLSHWPRIAYNLKFNHSHTHLHTIGPRFVEDLYLGLGRKLEHYQETHTYIFHKDSLWWELNLKFQGRHANFLASVIC